MAKQPCVECKTRPKFGSRQRCRVCYVRHLGITERVNESRRRGGMVPEVLRKRVVPAKLWPAGTRWCGGCQTFADLEDFGKGASQCRACVSSKSHAAMVEKTYGIGGSEYERLFELQGGRCAICRNRPKKTRLAVDHDHKTGEVRGLVCSNCNHDLLGGAHDNVNILFAAVWYMLQPPAGGAWVAPEARGEAKLSDLVAAASGGEAEKTPSKASRLSDPPDPYGAKNGAQAASVASMSPNFAPSDTAAGILAGLGMDLATEHALWGAIDRHLRIIDPPPF